MAKPTVVVTRRLPESVEKKLSELFDTHLNRTDTPYSASAIADAFRVADGILCTVSDRITSAQILAPSVRTRVLANFGVGVNHIDLEAAQKAGIVVSNTPDVLTDDTADLALALILMTARRLGEGERHIRSGAWSGWRPTHMLGHTLNGRKLGIVGYGRIGRATAKRAAALGMKVFWWAPREPTIQDPQTAGPPDAVKTSSLEELLSICDTVSLHCPATPETKHLINADRLRVMPAHAILVNTARGNVVDEHALVNALRERHIAGAGLDVFEFEPTVLPDLRDMENVVLLPHLGSATVQTRVAMGERAIRNLHAAFAGEIVPDRVV